MGNITLLNMSENILDSLTNRFDTFEETYNIKFEGHGRLITDITSITLHMIEERNCAAEWGGYLAIDNDTRAIIGTCAFKGNPSDKGEVEVAYFTFPKFEGRGYATMMVKELIGIAQKNEMVKLVYAHSLPEKNASTRVLEKCELELKGEIMDPEDGKVWQWEYLINR